MAGKNKLSIDLIFKIFVIVILAYVAYKLIIAINSFAKDPVKQMFGFAVALLNEITGLVNRCASCKDVYDSDQKLVPPKVACPPNGRPFFNRNCEEGLIIFFALFGSTLATILSILFRGKYGKTELAKAIEAATGKPTKDTLREISEANEKLESALEEDSTKLEDLRTGLKEDLTKDDADKIDLLTDKEIIQIGKNERTRRSLYDKLRTVSEYTSEKAKELVATAFDFARNLGSKNDITEEGKDQVEKNVGEIEMTELGPRIK